MSDFNLNLLLEKLTNVRGLALVNGLTCRTEFALAIHERLLDEIESIRNDIRAELDMERQLIAARGTPDGDYQYNIFRLGRRLVEKGIFDSPISLLDCIEYGDIRLSADEYSIVPAEELDGLAPILAHIWKKTGVQFIVPRVNKRDRDLDDQLPF